jgi:hypothetical protein
MINNYATGLSQLLARVSRGIGSACRTRTPDGTGVNHVIAAITDASLVKAFWPNSRGCSHRSRYSCGCSRMRSRRASLTLEACSRHRRPRHPLLDINGEKGT